jgi:hypothetical protein
VGVVVDRYPETVEALSAAGHEVEPRTAHWGSPRAYVRDPAGYLVELMAWAPGEPGPPRGETGPPQGETGPPRGEPRAPHGRKASPPGQTGQ